jgi:multidrug resistance efflux pump
MFLAFPRTTILVSLGVAVFLAAVNNSLGAGKSSHPSNAAATQDSSEQAAPTSEKPADDKSPAATAVEDQPQESSDKSAENDKPDKDSGEDKKTEEPVAELQADAQKAAEPHVVTAKKLTIEQELDGVFIATEMQEVAVRPETWTRFTVQDVVEHGIEVKKGDVLVRFDKEPFDEKLAEEEVNQRIGELALMQLEQDTPRSERLLEIAYQDAQRAFDQLSEDHQYYLKTDRPFMERFAQFRLASAKEDLASQQEELGQLKKMYEADELTEETETIVLRRQEFEVERAELNLELQQASTDYTLKVSLPRNDLYYATALEQAKLSLEKAKMAKELGTPRGRFELEKSRAERARSVKAHADLLSDKSLMELRAPIDGTVYYGRCINGQWSEISSLASKLIPYGTVTAQTVVMTVVKQRPLAVLCQVSEKGLTEIQVGGKSTIVPKADDKTELASTVAKVSAVPSASMKYPLELELSAESLPEWLVAGMTCTVNVVTYSKEDAIQIPANLLQTDEDNKKLKFVMLLLEGEEKPVRREVKVGHSKGKSVEILEGLKPGDRILAGDSKQADTKPQH